MALVVVKNLRKSFGKTVAVRDVSFAVRPGEVFGLLGPNGAGKTTTIRILLDIYQQDSGSVEILGGGFNQARANRIGYMPEERGLYPEMRVLPCLVFLGTLKGLTRKVARQRAEQYLERLELADQTRTKISALSRGMTQKVQVIASVLHEPDLLIIDEPFANLDPINAQLVRDIFLELRQEGKAVIMTSHQMALVETMCDRIALIHEGTVVLHGTVADVRRQFARNVLHLSGSGVFPAGIPHILHTEQRTTSDWFLTLAPSADTQAIVQAILTDGGFHLDRFEVSMPSLDEVFVQVVRGNETSPKLSRS